MNTWTEWQREHLPFEIYINRNGHFFAKIQWFLFKKFGIKRTIPCGRTKKDKYLCCLQGRFDEEHCYLSKDKHKAYCKCCGTMRMLSNQEIKFNEIWEY